MEYIDFVKRKVQLHHEIENAIKEMMMEKGVTEIDLLKDEESFDAGWLIRSIGDTNALEEVLVANIKVYFPEKGCHLGTNRSDNET